MKLLVLGTWSDGGFGKVTRELCTRWTALGVDLRILAVDHRGEPIHGPLQGLVWPASMLGGSHGSNTADAISGAFWTRFGQDWKPDAIFAIEDVTGLLARMGGKPDGAWASLPIWHYIPIEGDNLPPLWRPLFDLVRPVAMSAYGQRVLEAFTGKTIPLIYHGVDTDTFRPASVSDPLIVDGRRLSSKIACREAFGLNTTRNLILRSDALVTRKFYDRFVTAMRDVLLASPDTDVLMHTTAIRDGLDLYQELLRLPSELQGRIRMTGMHDTWRGLSEVELVALINAADVYVSTTGGEGFGLNLAEAAACEVPVVVTDWAASAEVVGPGGIAVAPLQDAYGESVRYHSEYGMDWAVPDPKAFLKPTLDLLERPSRRRALGSEGRKHVVANFSWDRAAAQFLRMFEEPDAALAAAS